MGKDKISKEESKKIIEVLKIRFEDNMHRHEGVEWGKVQEKLENNPKKLWSLNEMELTGGEPDVVEWDLEKGEYVFYDCAKESPAGRRSLCYDEEALEARKKNKPEGSALGTAKAMGIEILTEEYYRRLQEVEEIDLKTSSWVKTPVEIRKLKGALFCDRRYNHVFVYHNGADSYYASRGFRGMLRV